MLKLLLPPVGLQAAVNMHYLLLSPTVAPTLSNCYSCHLQQLSSNMTLQQTNLNAIAQHSATRVDNLQLPSLIHRQHP
jgi:hypothetical protein